MDYVGILIVATVVVLASKIWNVVWIFLWRPYVLTKRFGKQGVRGPPYSLCFGSLTEMKNLKMEANHTLLDPTSNHILPRILPHYHKWCPQYDCNPAVLALTGKGVALVNGAEWSRRRRIVNPAFSVDKLKVMVKRIVKCTISTLEEWENQANSAEEKCLKVEINGEFRKLTADIIAHTAFGSSYAQGKEAFKAQNDLQHYCADSILDVFIPGSHYLPTPSNLQLWKLDGRIRNSLKQIIKNRLTSSDSDCGHGDDLLGLMIGASENTDIKDGQRLNMDEIVEECKTFFFAGHETSANLLTWTVFLLSINQDWQTRLREEVFKESGMSNPDADILARFKLIHMVLLETLRLYGPVVEMFKQASKDMKLGNLTIPKDGWVALPLAKIHRSKEYWGDDADEFNPFRFSNGISKAAKHPNAFLAFGFGPRSCVGQNFAMMEVKTVLSMILQRFSFSLSSDYKHAPVDYLALRPQYGLPIILKPLCTK
ncbi:cytochrome P450 709B2-like isoform X2 [Euphorbia lathyris]|uniref:cytochrome P450 709B2-like isoform X2 n=1 Tax=Euphorbia lathyris TaxID=212925 RepID=UPI003313E559